MMSPQHHRWCHLGREMLWVTPSNLIKFIFSQSCWCIRSQTKNLTISGLIFFSHQPDGPGIALPTSAIKKRSSDLSRITDTTEKVTEPGSGFRVSGLQLQCSLHKGRLPSGCLPGLAPSSSSFFSHPPSLDLPRGWLISLSCGRGERKREMVK